MTQQLSLASGARRIRLIASFEAIKGFLALVLSSGVFWTFGESLNEAAQELVLGLHLDGSQRVPDAFIDAITSMRPDQVWMIVVLAIAYAVIRFAEAYGLWQQRRWAAWVSALSGGIYLPIEAYDLSKGLSWFRVVAAVANLIIVGYMVVVLWHSRRRNG